MRAARLRTISRLYCYRDGDQYVHLLYGPDPIFLSDGEVKVDVKGLVYKPQSRIYKGRLIADV